MLAALLSLGVTQLCNTTCMIVECLSPGLTAVHAVQVTAEVDTSRRAGARRHHTATHLLQSALKTILKEEGEVSQQVNSLLLSMRLPYDSECSTCCCECCLCVHASADQSIL